MAAFVIVTTADLPEAYFLAACLEARAQRLAIVNIVARPVGSQLRILTRLRRNRGTRYVADLALARMADVVARRRTPHGAGAFPEVNARLVRRIRSRHPHIDCDDPHTGDVRAFVGRVAPDYILLAGCPILKPSLYGLARRAALNRHLGLLPEFRGSDCAVWAFAMQRPDSAGYSIHVVNERVDAGDVIVRRAVALGDEPCLGDYVRRLAREGSNAFVELLDRLLHGAPLVAETQPWRGPYFPPAPWSVRRRAERNYARVLGARDARPPARDRVPSGAPSSG
jgi:folate-dependent phosphoribosylglycinamide formyltransferase PurN